MKRVRAQPGSFQARLAAILGGCAGLACITMWTPSAPAQNAKVPPNTRVTDCTTSGCHSDQIKFKFLHAPTAAGACEMCHTLTDEAKHTFKYKHEGAAMCDFCHIGKTDTAGLHVHAPVQNGECVKCHNPHGSDMRNLINGPTVGAMCLTCHESVTKNKSHLHSPISQGDCLGCHKPHSSVFPQLLVQQGRDLCLRCHADVATGASHGAAMNNSAANQNIATTHQLASNSPGGPASATLAADIANTNPKSPIENPKFIHPPFQGECTQCHDQHGSNYESLLKQDTVSLCKSCHEKVTEAALNAPVPHAPVVDAMHSGGKACVSCHSPHVSPQPKLLKEPTVELCLSCHNQELTRPDGTKVPSIAAMAQKDQHLHGALAQGNCSTCHDVHGGAHANLLTKNFSTSFYQTFNSEAYSLCFSCHKEELATAKNTTSATSFRNGDVNLHYVHVTAPGDSGRNCRVCHDTHSASNAKLVRDSVPFGQWNVPIDFKLTETGGSCGAGCHRSRGYDRVNAIVTQTSSTP